MALNLAYSIISIPLNTKPLKRSDYCYFCKKRSKNVFVVEADKGSKIICLQCKRAVEKDLNKYKKKLPHSFFVQGKIIISGGAPFSNRRKF